MFDGTLGDPNYINTMFFRPIDSGDPVDWMTIGIVAPGAFSVNTVVPEPSIMMLFGIDILGFAGVNSRKKYYSIEALADKMDHALISPYSA